MRYWWVNQNHTYQHEVPGGYLWSPKLKANGAPNPFYEFMREVSPGDVVFSFSNTKIPAIGIARSYAYEAPKPAEFGNVGLNWEKIGWRVDVVFSELRSPIRPVEHIERIRPYLPERYAPLQSSGAGLQGVYLTELNALLAGLLIDLIGSEARSIVMTWQAMQNVPDIAIDGQVVWEAHQIEVVRTDPNLTETDKQAIVVSRRGQGLFRKRVAAIERACRITGVTQPEFLRASHCKPWRDASNAERLDAENGLMLTPDVDLLFDRGFIGFDDSGEVWISPVADTDAFAKMGLAPEKLKNVGSFSEGQKHFLRFHRENVFLQSRFRSR